jgi:hypothetical protein
MKRQARHVYGRLALAALIGGAVWAWRGANRTHQTRGPATHAQASAGPGTEIFRAPIAPIQLHLIPRTQPTPLSSSSSALRSAQ